MCERCEELEEHVRQLEAELYGLAWRPPASWRLSRSQEAILSALVTRPGDFISRETLFSATRHALRDWDEEADMKVIDVQISKMRSALRRVLPDITISNKFGFGYGLSFHDAERLRDAAGRQREAA